MFIDTRSEFIFKDPDALDALLHYDWRIRKVLTDDEVVGAGSRPGAVIGADGSPSILRHMQRLHAIRAVHGVRRQGGRMRLWRIEEVLKLQIALDLKARTGQRMSHCADVIAGESGDIGQIIASWHDHVGTARESAEPARLKRYDGDLLSDRTRLLETARASVRDFVARNRFDAVEAPAFLL